MNDDVHMDSTIAGQWIHVVNWQDACVKTVCLTVWAVAPNSLKSISYYPGRAWIWFHIIPAWFTLPLLRFRYNGKLLCWQLLILLLNKTCEAHNIEDLKSNRNHTSVNSIKTTQGDDCFYYFSYPPRQRVRALIYLKIQTIINYFYNCYFNSDAYFIK